MTTPCFRLVRRHIAAIGLWALLGLAHGVGVASTEPRRPDPLDPQASVPALRFSPGFQHYQPFAEQAVGDWRAANEATRRAGGWRTYARELQPAAAAERQRP